MVIGSGHPPRQRSAPARQATLREHNLALVMAELADAGPTSRARLAAVTGLTKGTVSSLVEALHGAGLVTELGPDAAASVGRPGQTVGLSPCGPVGIGLEVNVDYLTTCTVDLTGAVRGRELVTQDFRAVDPAAVLDRAAAALRRAVDGALADGLVVAGAAVAVPGLVDAGAEVLRLAPNLGWRDVAVLDELRARADLGTLGLRLDNEANLAALGELWCGGQVSRADASFIHVSGEVGVGAGLVLQGRLFRGMRGYSGEVGHVSVSAAGVSVAVAACGCGATGCLEQLAGQEAILRSAGLAVTPSTTIGRPEGSVGELVGRATAGDERAVTAIRDAGHALGTGIAALVNLLDLDTVVLGGLYAVLAPWLLEPVEAVLAQRVLAYPWAPVSVLVSRLGGEAAVRGAATSVLRDVVHDPAAYLARSAS